MRENRSWGQKLCSRYRDIRELSGRWKGVVIIQASFILDGGFSGSNCPGVVVIGDTV